MYIVGPLNHAGIYNSSDVYILVCVLNVSKRYFKNDVIKVEPGINCLIPDQIGERRKTKE